MIMVYGVALCGIYYIMVLCGIYCIIWLYVVFFYVI